VPKQKGRRAEALPAFLPFPPVLPYSFSVVVGVIVLLRCVWDFFATGKGTLGPTDPSCVLVVGGLYRFTPNPMYNGVLAVIVGEAWLFDSVSLIKYALLVLVLFHLFVVLYEEPALTSQFGDSYRVYRRAVPRWGFRTRPISRGHRLTCRCSRSLEVAINAAYMDSSLVSARIRSRDQDRMQSYIRPLLKPQWLRAMIGIRAPRANQ